MRISLWSAFTVLWIGISSIQGQTITEYSIPSAVTAGNICQGTDNATWFVDDSSNGIGRIDLTTHAVTEVTVPSGGGNTASLVGCAFSPAGILYFADQNNFKIYKYTVSSNTFAQFAIPASPAGVAGSAWNTADSVLYTVALTASKIIRMQSDGTFLSTISLTAGRGPHGPSACSDNNVWFAEDAGNRVAFVDTAGTVSEFSLPNASSAPFSTTCASDNGVYVSENSGNRIARVDMTTHAITETTIPTASSAPKGIAAGNDGYVYFALSALNTIGVMQMGGGPIVQITVPTATTSPNKLTLGGDNSIWFSEHDVTKLGRLTRSAGVGLSILQ